MIGNLVMLSPYIKKESRVLANKASVNGNIVSAPHEVYLTMRAGGISLSLSHYLMTA